MPEDAVLKALTELKAKVDDLSAKVTTLERRWQLVTSVAMLLIGAIGGPQAVSLVNGGGA
jgi:hypothetical protein